MFVDDERVRAAVPAPDEYSPARVARDDVAAQPERHRRHRVRNLVNLRQQPAGSLGPLYELISALSYHKYN